MIFWRDRLTLGQQLGWDKFRRKELQKRQIALAMIIRDNMVIGLQVEDVWRCTLGLDAVGMVMEVEESFGITIPEDRAGIVRISWRFIRDRFGNELILRFFR